MEPTFEKRLAFGQVAESLIATWLRRVRGCTVIPIYEKEIGSGKGPRVFMPDGELVAPDMQVVRGGELSWIEAKHKTTFTWHRITQRWTTGIDQRHYQEYLKVSDLFPWPVWLMFLHEQSRPAEQDRQYAPGDSPTGLFGDDLRRLRCCVNHQSDKWGKNGMVYWAVGSLAKLATLTEVMTASEPSKQATAALTTPGRWDNDPEYMPLDYHLKHDAPDPSR